MEWVSNQTVSKAEARSGWTEVKKANLPVGQPWAMIWQSGGARAGLQ